MPGIATIPAYFKAGHASEFIGFLISIVIAFVLGVILTYFVGFEEEIAEEQGGAASAAEIEGSGNTASDSDTCSNGAVVEIASPVKGRVIPVTEVKDEVFASKGMGDGVGIMVEEGKVYAPFNGSVEALFPTGHAVGLATEGAEVLIHIGINTVELDGKGFQAHVQQGDTVKKGDLLVSFDKELIEKEGYDSTVIFIVTDLNEGRQLETKTGCTVDVLENVMRIR